MKDEYDFSNAKRGSILSTEGMTHVHLYINNETLEALGKQASQLGVGYQTLINSILSNHIEKGLSADDLSMESQPLNKALCEKRK